MSKSRYRAQIWWSEDDGSFLCSMPALSGVIADGKTRTGALANCEQLMREWLKAAKRRKCKIPEEDIVPKYERKRGRIIRYSDGSAYDTETGRWV